MAVVGSHVVAAQRGFDVKLNCEYIETVLYGFVTATFLFMV